MRDKMTSFIVVGNKFINLTRQPNTLTFDQLEHLLQRMIERPTLRTAYLVLLGQGLSDEQIIKLKQIVRDNHILNKLVVLKENSFMERSNKTLTHKYAKENILISEPFRIKNNKYASYLMIDDDCAEMSDHVTGQHLQGMLLVEAARQLTLAVTEKYFFDKSQRKNIGFVTNKLEVNFKHFAFPIETFIEYTIEQVRGNSINCSYQVIIYFIQNDKIITEVKYGFSTFNKKFLDEKENTAALNAFSALKNKNEVEYDSAAA